MKICFMCFKALLSYIYLLLNWPFYDYKLNSFIFYHSSCLEVYFISLATASFSYLMTAWYYLFSILSYQPVFVFKFKMFFFQIPCRFILFFFFKSGCKSIFWIFRALIIHLIVAMVEFESTMLIFAFNVASILFLGRSPYSNQRLNILRTGCSFHEVPSLAALCSLLGVYPGTDPNLEVSGFTKESPLLSPEFQFQFSPLSTVKQI